MFSGHASFQTGSGTGTRWIAPPRLSELSLCPLLAFEVPRTFRAAAAASSSTEAKESDFLVTREHRRGVADLLPGKNGQPAVIAEPPEGKCGRKRLLCLLLRF
jgi:hypothetical protein